MPHDQPPIPADPDLLERNLEALARSSPDAAARIRAAAPRDDAVFHRARDGAITGRIGGQAEPPRPPAGEPPESPGVALTEDAGAIPDFSLGLVDDPGLGLDGTDAERGAQAQPRRAMASRTAPRREARRFAEKFDPLETGGVMILGFALGHHVAAAAERLGANGIVLCFEPDLGLLRAVLERVDHSGWLCETGLRLLTDPDDVAALTQALSGHESLVAMGVRLLAHPPSEARLGEPASRFSDNFVKVISATRTTLATTLVHSTTTLRNQLGNAAEYVTRPGVLDLAGLAEARPAIVVAAGPSLSRNIDQLADPAVRERFVIIAVQTVLRPLLRRGIRPHYVVALDHHEISGRFYEGLSESDVEGVTLVAEPKCNPAILRGFPGEIRLVQDDWFDRVIGPDLQRQMGRVELGATVTQLGCYLARHLGCDPLITVGLDLGFTDGQYYAASAAIHDTWACELGPFRSLESLEWERIVRQRSLLRKKTDFLGRPMYTDEQMATYLAQLERDFQRDAAMGLTVIDATEGGVSKLGADTLPLAAALARFDDPRPLDLPAHAPAVADRDQRLEAARDRLREVCEQTGRVRELCDETAELLEEMLDHLGDHRRVDRLIDEVYRCRDRVRLIEPAYEMTQFINQTGALNRLRQDRTLTLESDALTPVERQRRQIQRDIQNVRWLGDAADEVGRMTRHALELAGGRDAPAAGRDAPLDTPDDARERPGEASAGRSPIDAAVLFADAELGGLGTPRDLGAALHRGRGALALTVERLLATRRVPRVLIAAGEPGRVRAMLGDLAGDSRVDVVGTDAHQLRERARAVGRARLFNADAWRGGLGGTTAFDESFDPRLLRDLMEEHGLSCVLLAGADWALLDPGLCDRLIERRAELPEVSAPVFTQAPPGLAGVILDRGLVDTLAGGLERVNPFATLGGLLGYAPRSPQADPIGKGFCVGVPPRVRDLGRRLIPDTPERVELIGRVLERVGPAADLETLAGAVEAIAPAAESAPGHLVLELCTGRLSQGPWAAWRREADPAWGERPAMDERAAIELVRELGAARPDATLTLDGVGDPLMHPAALRVIEEAKRAGVAAVHLRTDLMRTEIETDRLLGSGVDAISLDLLAVSDELAAHLHGRDGGAEATARAIALAEASIRRGAGGLPSPWIVPRITRCDEAYAEIEPFYDAWIMTAGSAVIDPLPAAEPGARIGPLPTPGLARDRTLRRTLVIRSDGSAADGLARPIDARPGAGLADLWAAHRRGLRPGSRHDEAPGPELRIVRPAGEGAAA